MTDCRTIAEQAIKYGALQKLEELTRFLELLSSVAPKVIVEIGVFDGATLWAWQQVAETVIGIDTSPRVKAPTTATRIVGDSHEPSTLVALAETLAGAQIDCLFLDADHSYVGVHRDYHMYRPLVRRGGLIAFHDIASVAPSVGQQEFYGVAKFWSEVRSNGNALEIIDTAPGSGGRWGDDWGGIGVLTGCLSCEPCEPEHAGMIQARQGAAG